MKPRNVTKRYDWEKIIAPHRLEGETVRQCLARIVGTENNWTHASNLLGVPYTAVRGKMRCIVPSDFSHVEDGLKDTEDYGQKMRDSFAGCETEEQKQARRFQILCRQYAEQRSDYRCYP